MKTEVDLPAHLLKMCAKVEKKTIEKCQKSFAEQVQTIGQEHEETISELKQLIKVDDSDRLSQVDIDRKLLDFTEKIDIVMKHRHSDSLLMKQFERQIQALCESHRQETEESLHSICNMVEDLAKMSRSRELG